MRPVHGNTLVCKVPAQCNGACLLNLPFELQHHLFFQSPHPPRDREDRQGEREKRREGERTNERDEKAELRRDWERMKKRKQTRERCEKIKGKEKERKRASV